MCLAEPDTLAHFLVGHLLQPGCSPVLQRHHHYYRTSSQINDTFLFHRVLKILTAGRILQISIAWCQIEAEIHSFPTMYGKGGVDVVKIGEIKVSVQKLCLKQGFFEDTNLDHLTSGWPRTHCFRGDANFDMFPKKYG